MCNDEKLNQDEKTVFGVEIRGTFLGVDAKIMVVILLFVFAFLIYFGQITRNLKIMQPQPTQIISSPEHQEKKLVEIIYLDKDQKLINAGLRDSKLWIVSKPMANNDRAESYKIYQFDNSYSFTTYRATWKKTSEITIEESKNNQTLEK